MHWKHWPYWVKGGILGLAIYGFATLLLFPFGLGENEWFPYWSWPTILGAMPLSSLLHSLSGKDFMDEFIYIFPLVTYFISFALLGYLYGKISSKGAAPAGGQGSASGGKTRKSPITS